MGRRPRPGTGENKTDTGAEGRSGQTHRWLVPASLLGGWSGNDAWQESSRAGKRRKKTEKALQALPIGIKRGKQKLQYVWDGTIIKAVHPDKDGHNNTPGGLLGRSLGGLRDRLWSGFFPSRKSVTPDYWDFVRWRCTHRFFGSLVRLFGTQSLLVAVGVGGRDALTASAAINWMLKDGLGRVARMTVATRYGDVFDSNLKRMRFSTAILFSACMLCEVLTPFLRRHFLLLASIANVGKAVSLTTHVSTSPALASSLCLESNLADITAKTQAVYPVGTAVDLYATYRELKAVELRSLNCERVQMIADHWVRTGGLRSPKEISRLESLLGEPNIGGGFLPLSIGPADKLAASPHELQALMNHHRHDRYMLGYQRQQRVGFRRMGESIAVSLSEEATSRDIVTAILQATHLRALLRARNPMSASAPNAEVEALEISSMLEESRRRARRGAGSFMKRLCAAGWTCHPFLLSATEKQTYTLL
eukprot:evm.model.scf_481.5 EVM.evm.TU.scf_481.5   scf_481:67877-76451(-)